jgi:hypothetical protein
LNLLREVGRLLASRRIDHALIGAAALAAHGVARATADFDLLVVDPACLDDALWASLRSSGLDIRIRPGDEADPLAGVVRIASKDETTIDVVVGKLGWQREALGRARANRIGDAELPVVSAADLVLLKLYAGGPQDAWDVDQLLDVDPRLAAAVEARLSLLPAECTALWRRILDSRASAR